MQLERWTGRDAAALQSALRLTNEGLADKLGVALRTVSTWHARPDVQPRAEIQQALDTVLARASGTERARFEYVRGQATEVPADAPESLRVAVAIVADAERVLLVSRRSDAGSQLRWQFPAGIVKPGGSAERVAERETLAETGVRCMALRLLGSRLHPVTKVVCEYVVCGYLDGTPANLDPVENVDVTWVEIPKLTSYIPVENIYPPILEALNQ
ncbi:MAG: NUDIX hydrolase [Angustibacter sp.]